MRRISSRRRSLSRPAQAWDRTRTPARWTLRAWAMEHAHLLAAPLTDECPTDEIPDRPVADLRHGSDLQDTPGGQSTCCRSGCGRRWCCATTRTRARQRLTRLEVSLGTVKSTVSRAVAKPRIGADPLAEDRARRAAVSGSQRTFRRWHGTIHPGRSATCEFRRPADSRHIAGALLMSVQHDDGRS
jgi:hypothetical protein